MKMNTHLKVLSQQISLMAGLFLLICGFSLTAKSQERVINYVPIYNAKSAKEMVEITNIKVKKSAVLFDNSFIAKGDWLNGLTVTVKNVSDKPIAFIRLFLDFPETKDVKTDSTFGWLIEYGQKQKQNNSLKNNKLVNPQESVDLVLWEDRYNEFQEWINGIIQAQNINKVSIRVGEVIFDDDTKWFAGQFFRRDPKNTLRWIHIR
jgi:hypothetical protein